MFLPNLGVKAFYVLGGQSERQNPAARRLDPDSLFSAAAVTALCLRDICVAGLPEQQTGAKAVQGRSHKSQPG